MTKAELVAAMADKTGLSRDAAKKALDAFTESVVDSLKKGEDVRLVGFGTFLPVKRAAGMARNPRTGEQVQRAASKTARFRVGEGLKGALNGK
jgi:DNA-binding protein HU-beta